jgi:pimeloyl-ACP methyl ester carboxylesterase
MKSDVRAFLIYGLIGGPFPWGLGYSLGFDLLAEKLRANGIDATTHVEGVLIPFTNVANLAARAHDAAQAGKRLVLVGHSMGADAAVRVARRLAGERIAVDLLVAFDPTRFACPEVPGNVRRALCFYQKEYAEVLGRGRLHPAADFSGELLNERVSYRHKVMDDAPELHARVVEEARKLAAG